MRALVVPEFYRSDVTANGTVNDAVAWIREWLARADSLHIYLLAPPREDAGYKAGTLLGDRERVTLVEAAPSLAALDRREPFTETGYSAEQLRAIRREERRPAVRSRPAAPRRTRHPNAADERGADPRRVPRAGVGRGSRRGVPRDLRARARTWRPRGRRERLRDDGAHPVRAGGLGAGARSPGDAVGCRVRAPRPPAARARRRVSRPCRRGRRGLGRRRRRESRPRRSRTRGARDGRLRPADVPRPPGARGQQDRAVRFRKAPGNRRARRGDFQDRFTLPALAERTAAYTDDGVPLTEWDSYAPTDLRYTLRALGFVDTGTAGTPVFEDG